MYVFFNVELITKNLLLKCSYNYSLTKSNNPNALKNNKLTKVRP